MREIKFRGRKINTNKWIVGNLGYTKTSSGNSGILVDGKLHIIDSETVGQYTGLQDMHGNEIYEGDVLKIFIPNDPEEKVYVSKVYELDGAFTVDMVGYDIYTDVHCVGWIPEDYSVEIIGSIYKSPNLIQGGSRK